VQDVRPDRTKHHAVYSGPQLSIAQRHSLPPPLSHTIYLPVSHTKVCAWAKNAAESLDGRIEDEDLNGMAEAVEVREALERVQALSLEVSEELDAYQTRHGG
jgi:hypothetical protein